MTAKHSSMSVFRRPQSVAVIGASDSQGKVGHRVLKNLIDWNYEGIIFPVNPSVASVMGLASYPNLGALPMIPDVVIVAIPGPGVLSVVQEAGELGVAGAVVLSSGFSETGPEGAAIEARIGQVGRDTGIRILGPNCLGIINVLDGVCLSWSLALGQPDALVAGDVGVISQSGAIGVALSAALNDRDIGVCDWVVVGNEVDINFADAVAYLVESGNATSIFGYMEALRRPTELREALANASEAGVQVFIVKGGTSVAGAAASRTHTGALIGNAPAHTAFLEQAGAIVGTSIEDVADALEFHRHDVKASGDSNVVILTNSGGLGVLAADECYRADLPLNQFTADQQVKLREILPSFLTTANPLDFSTAHIADPRSVADMVRIIDSQGSRNSIYLIGLVGARVAAGWDIPTIIGALADVRDELGSNIVVVSVGGDELVLSEARARRVPAVTSVRKFVGAVTQLRKAARMDHVGRRGTAMHSSESDDLEDFQLDESALDTTRAVSELPAKEFLRTQGISVPGGKAVETLDEVLSTARQLGFPVVLKIVGEALFHKTEVGGVKIGISNDAELANAFECLSNVFDGLGSSIKPLFLVEEMIDGVGEVIVGMSRDPVVGPVLMVGAGGRQAELLADVCIRVGTVDREQAELMIRSLKTFPLLNGFRGSEKANVSALAALVATVSSMAAEDPLLTSVDLNPVIVGSSSAIVVDALLEFSIASETGDRPRLEELSRATGHTAPRSD
jgi:acetate---CoA ligase (ADP-forming)